MRGLKLPKLSKLLKLPKLKKRLLLAVGILAGIVCVLCMGRAALASGLTGAEPVGNYLFSKFPIENYMLDSWVDTSGNWIPWNWGKALDDGMYSILAYLIGSVYLSIFRFFSIIGYFIQMVYSTDVVNPLMETVVHFVQNVAGFDGGFLPDGLFAQLLAVIVIITGLYYGMKLLHKETGESISGVAVFCLLIVVSLGFFYKADVIVKGANDIAMSIQSVVVRAGNNALGIDGDPAVAIREGLFDITVYQPYLLLQYNDNTIPREKAEEILSLESGSEAREELVKQEVANGNQMMNGMYGLNLRMSNLLPLVLSGAVLAVVILIMVCMNIYHQFAFLLYVCFSPFALILSLLPGKSQVAVRLLGKIFYELCMRIALAMLICLMYGFSSAIYTITGAEGYIFGAVLQAIIYVVVFLFRKKIYEFFTSDKKPSVKKGGIRSTVGSFYMANRGLKALGSILGSKGSPNAASAAQNAFRPRPPKGTNPEQIGMGEKTGGQRTKTEGARREPGAGASGMGAYAARRKAGADTPVQSKMAKQPVRAGSPQTSTRQNGQHSMGMPKGGGKRNSQPLMGIGNSSGKPGALGSSSYRNAILRYGISGGGMVKGGYKPARKENVPHIRGAQFRRQVQNRDGLAERRNVKEETGGNARESYAVRQKKPTRTTDSGSIGNIGSTKESGNAGTTGTARIRREKNIKRQNGESHVQIPAGYTVRHKGERTKKE